MQIKVGDGEWTTISITYYYSCAGWTRGFVDLNDYADSTVQIAFYFISRPSGTAAGWYVDDVEVVTGPRVFSNPEDW
ncbi:MAG: hypothetical protein KAJ37_13685, partial [Candidatus Krumholzibacteria bacterium]|nr:hypothetical protein [Candidatus Krumholzibacteria bacterium]